MAPRHRSHRLLSTLTAFALLLSLSCTTAVPSAPPTRGPAVTDGADGATAAALSTAQAAPSPVVTPSPAAGRLAGKPNVILITIDSLRADHLGTYGYFRNTTPNIDALARDGARFDMAITQFAQTNPSHASILTGNYPTTHKVKVHGVDKVDPSVTTLAETMSRIGYTTAAFYSWPSLDPGFSGLERGFATYQSVYQPDPSQESNPDLWRRFTGQADRTSDAVLDWLDMNQSSSFFLWVHYQDPHYPYNPPPPFNTLYDPNCLNCISGDWKTIDRVAAGEHLPADDVAHLLALYDGAIAYTDQQIGRVIDRLKGLSLLNETVIILTADHGDSFGENGRWLHPLVMYNSVLRVPLVLRYPPAVPAGTVSGVIAQSVDISPTILDLVDGPIAPQIEGSDLMPVINGTDDGAGRAAITQVPDDSSIALTTREWKLIRSNIRNEQELYDLRSDPKELNNVAGRYPEQVAQLEQQLKRWMERHGIRPQR